MNAEVLEVQINGRWHKVTEYIFRSWTGPRKKDGADYHGPVFSLGTDTITIEGR